MVGSTLNAGATGGALDIELEEMGKHLDCGLQFVITTPVFDPARFERLLKRIDTTRVAVIPTVMLLKSAGMARYINRNIGNVSIPEDIIDTIQKAPDKPRECIRIASEMITRVKDLGVAGVVVSTIGWEGRLPQILYSVGK